MAFVRRSLIRRAFPSPLEEYARRRHGWEGTTRADGAVADALERFPITSNHVIDKEKIKTLEQVHIEKVCQLFRNLL
ncbi:Hypothetical protein BN69_1548 [Methylocystis sp. SC2]|nr:Hypothetical protein BN69_1548 [Methylocystis sp. SC2]